MIPKLFEIPLPGGIGALPVYSFGLMMVLCFVAGWRRLYLSLEEAGENPALAERMITWGAVGGIIGGRVGYLLTFPEEFLANPLATAFGGAGFVFYGGFAGGVLALWILMRKEGKDFLHMADLTSATLALGYAVGRVGCQLSGDGDYGKAAQLPWAMGYPYGVVPTLPGELVHPTPVYETLLSLLIAAILLSPRVRMRLSARGQLFGLYLILSAASRFLVEFVRREPVLLASLTEAQLVAPVLMVIGIRLIWRPPPLRPL